MVVEFRRERKRRLWEKTDFRCWYCGEVCPEDQMTLDHFVPRCEGGSDEDSNLVPSCRSCNGAKGPLTVEQFRDKRTHQHRLTEGVTLRYIFAFERNGWRIP